AGVTWGVIQYHFGDRNGMLMAVVDDGVARLVDSLSAANVSELPLRERIEVVVDTAWSCYSSPTSMAAFEILRATRGGPGASSRRHLHEMNAAIGQLGRLITDDPANAGVAEVIWAALRGVVLAGMLTGTAVDWSLERRALIDMVTRVLQ
ncbi:MAG TPA: TetR/AcrR family transcriptional regulator, partial [Mycobacterium sp.]|nr:TetR/AcrR family transcriptional regulator [Mycobacterium sp.]